MPGGLCVTREREGFRYDLGGHIPFVDAARRREWLEQLLGGDLRWVDRPVSCVREGRIVRGRYLDQRPETPEPPGPRDVSAAGELGWRFGIGFVDRVMRPYLEKVDGLPLERIPGERAVRLLEDQAAPDGFLFPAQGIGQLMDVMAAAARAAGARVPPGSPGARAAGAAGTDERRAGGGRRRRPGSVRAEHAVVALPPSAAARLLDPAAARGDDPRRAHARGRASSTWCVPLERLTLEPWIQVDDPRVPFSRAFEPVNWSPALAPAGPHRDRAGVLLPRRGRRSGLGPLRRRARRVVRRVRSATRWAGSTTPPRRGLLEVVRLPRAYPEADLAQVAGRARAGALAGRPRGACTWRPARRSSRPSRPASGRRGPCWRAGSRGRPLRGAPSASLGRWRGSRHPELRGRFVELLDRGARHRPSARAPPLRAGTARSPRATAAWSCCRRRPTRWPRACASRASSASPWCRAAPAPASAGARSRSTGRIVLSVARMTRILEVDAGRALRAGGAGGAEPRPVHGGAPPRAALRARPLQPAGLLDRRQRRHQRGRPALPGLGRHRPARARAWRSCSATARCCAWAARRPTRPATTCAGSSWAARARSAW